MVAVGLTMLLLVVAACGGANPGNSVEGGQSGAPAGNDEPAGQGELAPRTITHLKGETEIPATINKIVALSAAYADHLLAIGEKPYAVNVEARYGGEYLPYLAEGLAGVEVVGSADIPNLEAILQLDPDVILIESRTAETTYEQLNKIAPTIVMGTEWLEYEDDATYWTKDLLQVAQLYGKEQAAQELIAELDAKVADAKAKIAQLPNKRLAYLRVRENVVQIYAQTGHPMNTLLYHDLGFEPTSLTPADQRAELSMELLPDLDADFIMLEVDPNGYSYLDTIKESPLWSNIPAVVAGNVYETDSFWLFKGWGVIGRGLIVDDILKQLD